MRDRPKDRSRDADYAPFWVAFYGLPTAGAMLGFHLSAKSAERGLRLSVAPGWQGNGPGLLASIAF